jgi:hypothetical protein
MKRTCSSGCICATTGVEPTTDGSTSSSTEVTSGSSSTEVTSGSCSSSSSTEVTSS